MKQLFISGKSVFLFNHVERTHDWGLEILKNNPDADLTVIPELNGKGVWSGSGSVGEVLIIPESSENKIELIIGDATEIVPKLDKEFQFVFIDADKENYIEYFELALPKVSKGGFILADNVLWSGKVLTEPHRNDKDTIAIMEFNNFIQQDKRIENVLLPIRDGLMLIRKL